MQAFSTLSDNMKGATILMVATIAFAVTSALIKLTGERIPVAQILFIRQFGMLLMLSPALLHNFPEAIKTSRPGLQLIRVMFALVALYGGFTALVHLPLADATALGFAKGFFVTLTAVILLKESVGLYRWSAVFIGFLGVAIMVKPGTSGFNIYGFLAIAGAASAGVVMVIIRLLSRTETSHSIMGYQVFGVGLVMLIPTVLHWVWPTPLEWVLLAGVGISSYFGQKANIYAFKHGEASLLASLDYVRLLYATLFGYFLFGQLPEFSTWVGAGIIVLASIFTVYREAKRKQVLNSAPEVGGGFHGN